MRADVCVRVCACDCVVHVPGTVLYVEKRVYFHHSAVECILKEPLSLHIRACARVFM
jgi:hypothetical protein